MSHYILPIYKPIGVTSNHVLQNIRRQIGPVKIGHAGTLDPLAEGVLVIGIGREATKQLAEVVKKEKEYIADITFGMTSTTDDEEGEKTVMKVTTPPDEKDVGDAIKKFVGDITQIPPIYSAIKIDGKEAYKRARKGENVQMKGRPAYIKEIELCTYKWPVLQIRVVTGPGVYIRALARDIGEELQVGGYLSKLIRTRVGDFSIDDAIRPEDLADKIE